MTEVIRAFDAAERKKEEGNSHFKRKQWAEARELFEQAIAILSSSMEAEDSHGRMRSEEGSSAEIEEVVEKNELLAKCHLNRAMASQRLAVALAVKKGREEAVVPRKHLLVGGVEDCDAAINLKAEPYKKALLKKADLYRELLDIDAWRLDDVPTRLSRYEEIIATLDKCHQVGIDFDDSSTDTVNKCGRSIVAMRLSVKLLIDKEEKEDRDSAPPPSRKTIKVSFSPGGSSPPPPSPPSKGTLKSSTLFISRSSEEAVSRGKANGHPREGVPLSLSPDGKRRENILRLIKQDKFDESGITESYFGCCRFLIHVKWWNEMLSSLSPPLTETETETETETGTRPCAGAGAGAGAAVEEVNNWRLLHSATKLKKTAVGKLGRYYSADEKSRLVNEQLDGYRLKEDRKKGKHYVSVTRDIWEAIYGLYGGGPALPRFVRRNPDGLFLDVRPDLPFSQQELSLVAPFLKHRGDTPMAVRGKRLKATFPPNDCGATVTQYNQNQKSDNSNRQHSSGEEKTTDDEDDGEFQFTNSCFVCGNHATSHCARCHSVHYCGRECQAAHWRFHKSWCKQAADSQDLHRVDFCKVVNVGRRGHVGLQNLGNSCYLNSIVQCMSHMKPLTSFFLSGAYESQLNEEAVFGTKGRMVHEYASLLQNLWFGDKQVIYPKSFKSLLGKLNNDWAGAAQQDSTEVMLYILDKLHEDLNRVKKKPYVEKGEGDGSNCLEVAAEEWKKSYLREDSEVRDIIGGLYRSRLLCPECGKESVSFEPFCDIQVELKLTSSSSVATLKFLYFPSKDHSSPFCFVLKMRRSQSMEWLEEEVKAFVRNNIISGSNGSIGNKNEEVFLEFFRMTDDMRSVRSHLSENPQIKLHEKYFPETHAIAVYPISKVNDDDFLMTFLLHRHVVMSTSSRSSTPIEMELAGKPLMIGLKASDTCYKLRGLMWKKIVKFLKKNSSIMIELKRLKLSGDVKANVDFHKRMSTLLPIRYASSKGGGKSSEAALKKKTPEPRVDEDFSCMVDKAYELGDVVELGAPLPYDETTTIDEFFGGQKRGFPFFAMDWVKGGYFADSLDLDALENVESHSSVESYRESTKSRSASERRSGGRGDLTIEQCLQAYTKEEMQEECIWKCSRCKKDQIPQKKIDFLAGYLPDVMIVVLKRFAHRNLELFRGSGTYGHSQKIDLRVDFPLEGLDMAPFCTDRSLAANDASEEDYLYDLFAACNHHGRMGFGHYTAIARDWLPDGDLDARWVRYDDDSVEPVIDSDEVQSSAAYVLFYRRRGIKQREVK